MLQVALNPSKTDGPVDSKDKKASISLEELAALSLLSHASKSLGSTAKSASKSPPAPQLNPIVQALLDQIETDHEIDQLTSESVKALLQNANSQITALLGIGAQLAELKNELKGQMPVAQAEALEAKIKQLETLYENALADSKTTKDPKQKEEDLAEIKAAMAGMESLASKYPGFKSQLDRVFAAMSSGKDIKDLVGSLVNSVNQVIAQDNELEKEIQALTQKLAQGLEHLIPDVKSNCLMALRVGLQDVLGDLIEFLENFDAKLKEACLAKVNTLTKYKQFKADIQQLLNYSSLLVDRERGLPMPAITQAN